MKKRRSKSWAMAYCGMAAALCVALMLLGTIIPIAMFIAPAVASLLIATVCMECGITMAWTAYAAVSLLGLLFVPDKEIALIFTVLLGYYPLVKPRFDRIRPGHCSWCASCCCATGGAGDVRPAAGAGAGGQHFAGAAHHRTGNDSAHAGYGQRGVCPVRPRPVQSAAAVQAEVAAQAA